MGTSVPALLEDLAEPEDKQWKGFIQELIEQSQPLDKNGLKKLIKKHYHTSRNQHKSIRRVLLEQGIILSFSKTNDSLFDKMVDLLSIRAGEIDNGATWYSVDYYHTSFQKKLTHMVNLRIIKSLQARIYIRISYHYSMLILFATTTRPYCPSLRSICGR